MKITLTTAVVIGGKIKPAGKTIDVKEHIARDLIRRESAKLPETKNSEGAKK